MKVQLGHHVMITPEQYNEFDEQAHLSKSKSKRVARSKSLPPMRFIQRKRRHSRNSRIEDKWETHMIKEMEALDVTDKDDTMEEMLIIDDHEEEDEELVSSEDDSNIDQHNPYWQMFN